ncbi:Exosome complex component MTR3 [Penicillium macrosclerotiorum]|uniref:Exosome complex component MTR3 n=1 Tax=Penicillium macrosclerotiorum TaxID=303699 RepID=UPI002548BFEC|nr:Exosome complex component MTR3 [Penicillium macrosclerotiorum]KAJ5690542.1 Exosome complex component MTR3 [Penicillium macrosclerotiorum]
MMADRRRVNGPPGGTRPVVFASTAQSGTGAAERPRRQRQPTDLRKICKAHEAHFANFLKLVSFLLPLALHTLNLNRLLLSLLRANPKSLIPPSSALKLACTVHGPKPLPRSAAFSPNIVLTTHVKYAPFAARKRKGHIRDSNERDLGVHLETALRGAIIAERWPKSGLDITITILEAEDDRWWADTPDSHDASWGMMNVLAGCITAASAAIADAHIDCLDLVAGGVAALVSDSSDGSGVGSSGPKLMLDTDPAEHCSIMSACVVAYMPTRDEISELWLKGDSSKASLEDGDARSGHEALVDGAVDAARGAHTVLTQAVRESLLRTVGQS